MNFHISQLNTDIVLVNDYDTVKNISANTKKHIAHMQCQFPIGSSQIMSDGDSHFLSCNLKSFSDYYMKNSNINFIDQIKKLYNNQLRRNTWVKDRYAIFILEKDMPTITYSYILDFVNNNEFQIYLNGIENKNSIDRIMLYNLLNYSCPKADTSVYDKSNNELSLLYII